MPVRSKKTALLAGVLIPAMLVTSAATALEAPPPGLVRLAQAVDPNKPPARPAPPKPAAPKPAAVPAAPKPAAVPAAPKPAAAAPAAPRPPAAPVAPRPAAAPAAPRPPAAPPAPRPAAAPVAPRPVAQPAVPAPRQAPVAVPRAAPAAPAAVVQPPPPPRAPVPPPAVPAQPRVGQPAVPAVQQPVGRPAAPPRQVLPGQPAVVAPAQPQVGQPAVPGRQGIPGQPQVGQPVVPGRPVVPGQPVVAPGVPGQPQVGQPVVPGRPVVPGQPVVAPGVPGQPQIGQPVVPGRPVVPGQPVVAPGVPGQPQAGQPVVPGRPVVPGQPVVAPGVPGQPQIGQPGIPGRPVVPGQPVVAPVVPGQPQVGQPGIPGRQGIPGQPVVAPGVPGQPQLVQPGIPGRPVVPGQPVVVAPQRSQNIGRALAIGAGVGIVGGIIAGQAVRRYDDVRSRREEFTEDGYTVIREPGRVMVRENGRLYIQRDETERFRDIGGGRIQTDRRGEEIVTVYERPNGERVVTVTDENGRLLRRTRSLPDGREVVLINNGPRRPAYAIQEDVVVLPSPPLPIPRERYVVDAGAARPGEIYEALTAPPVAPVPRRYTLDQVRYSPDLRARMRSVDLNAITFESGSWTLDPAEEAKLGPIAQGLLQAIQQNPSEVFLVEGHTDAVGTDVENLSLSDRRAQAVATALTTKYAVPPENLTTQGYGEQYPKVQTQGAARENRRVTVRRITPLLEQQAQQPQQQPPG